MVDICDRKLHHSEGVLELGDFLGVISDGVMYAGTGLTMNFGWGRQQVTDFLEQIANGRPATAEVVVSRLMEKTNSLYRGEPGDDATLVGLLVRKPNRLMIFTGPPVDKNRDEDCVNRLLDFDGRKVVCGGTTGNIVAEHLGEIVHVDLGTMHEDVPPMGLLLDIDLVTEGVLTLARTLRFLKDSGGDHHLVPMDRNGASPLAVRRTLFSITNRAEDCFPKSAPNPASAKKHHPASGVFNCITKKASHWNPSIYCDLFNLVVKPTCWCAVR